MNIKKELIYEILAFCTGVLEIALFYHNNVLLTTLMILTWLICIQFWHTKHDLAFFVTGAIIGPASEIFCIWFGVWSYANPTFLGIPSWLPLGWGFATMLIKRIAETVVKLER